MEVSGQLHTQLYPQRKSPRYPLDKRLGGSQSRSAHEEKYPAPVGNWTPIIHPVASRYTDWAIMEFNSLNDSETQ
jgi:hypothetical protein